MLSYSLDKINIIKKIKKNYITPFFIGKIFIYQKINIININKFTKKNAILVHNQDGIQFSFDL